MDLCLASCTVSSIPIAERGSEWKELVRAFCEYSSQNQEGLGRHWATEGICACDTDKECPLAFARKAF